MKIIKQSTIKNLLVIPLIASAVMLASPVLAASPTTSTPTEIRHKTDRDGIPNIKKGVVGTVTSVTGNIIIVNTKDNILFTVDASKATIMKAGEQPNINPNIITISDIKVGDTIMVRGEIKDTEVIAEKVFDGKMFPMHHAKNVKHIKHIRHMNHLNKQG